MRSQSPLATPRSNFSVADIPPDGAAPQLLLLSENLAIEAHKGQLYGAPDEPRPYIEHIREVVDVLFAELGVRDLEVLAGGYLHDSQEDTQLRRAGIVERLGEPHGPPVADLVAALSRPPRGADQASMSQVEYRFTILLTYLRQIANGGPKAVLVKVADRIANMRQSLNEGRSGVHAANHLAEHEAFFGQLSRVRAWRPPAPGPGSSEFAPPLPEEEAHALQALQRSLDTAWTLYIQTLNALRARQQVPPVPAGGHHTRDLVITSHAGDGDDITGAIVGSLSMVETTEALFRDLRRPWHALGDEYVRDAIQAAWAELVVANRLRRIRDPEAARAWLRTTANRLLIRDSKRRQRELELETGQTALGESPVSASPWLGAERVVEGREASAFVDTLRPPDVGLCAWYAFLDAYQGGPGRPLQRFADAIGIDDLTVARARMEGIRDRLLDALALDALRDAGYAEESIAL